MRALSISRPWSHLILHHGKDPENRTWSTTYRGPVLIHAAKSWDDLDAEWLLDHGIDPAPFAPRRKAEHPTGIVGVIDLVRVCDLSIQGHHCSCGQWAAHGQYHFRLIRPRPFPEPIPCRGHLGLWVPPVEVLNALAAQGVTIDV